MTPASASASAPAAAPAANPSPHTRSSSFFGIFKSHSDSPSSSHIGRPMSIATDSARPPLASAAARRPSLNDHQKSSSSSVISNPPQSVPAQTTQAQVPTQPGQQTQTPHQQSQQHQQPQQQQLQPNQTRPQSAAVPSQSQLHPEIRSIVQLTLAHAHKIYFSGPLVRRIERLPDGSAPSLDEGWRDVWAQLGGTTLSVWDMKEIEEANRAGKEVPPTYINITDAFIQVLGAVTIPATATRPAQRYTNVVTVNSAGSNLLLFSCPDGPSLVAWAAALRLSSWEKSRLEEIYTAHLIRITLNNGQDTASPLVRGRLEGWARIRLSGQTDWKRVWMIVASPVSTDTSSQAANATTTSEFGATTGRKRRVSSLFGSSRSANHGGGGGSREESLGVPLSNKSLIAFYTAQKGKERKRPLLTFTNVNQAFAVYPERPELINRSTLLKLEGTTGDEDVAGSMRGREGWLLVMPELEPGFSQAREMLKWLIGIHDAFELYGRPKEYIWDPRHSSSLMFAYPVGSNRDMLFLDREGAEALDPREDRTSAVRQRLYAILMDRMREQGMLSPRAPKASVAPSLPPLPAVEGESPVEVSSGQREGQPKDKLPTFPQLPPLSFTGEAGSAAPETATASSSTPAPASSLSPINEAASPDRTETVQGNGNIAVEIPQAVAQDLSTMPLSPLRREDIHSIASQLQPTSTSPRPIGAQPGHDPLVSTALGLPQQQQISSTESSSDAARPMSFRTNTSASASSYAATSPPASVAWGAGGPQVPPKGVNASYDVLPSGSDTTPHSTDVHPQYDGQSPGVQSPMRFGSPAASHASQSQMSPRFASTVPPGSPRQQAQDPRQFTSPSAASLPSPPLTQVTAQSQAQAQVSPRLGSPSVPSSSQSPQLQSVQPGQHLPPRFGSPAGTSFLAYRVTPQQSPPPHTSMSPKPAEAQPVASSVPSAAPPAPEEMSSQTAVPPARTSSLVPLQGSSLYPQQNLTGSVNVSPATTSYQSSLMTSPYSPQHSPMTPLSARTATAQTGSGQARVPSEEEHAAMLNDAAGALYYMRQLEQGVDPAASRPPRMRDVPPPSLEEEEEEEEPEEDEDYEAASGQLAPLHPRASTSAARNQPGLDRRPTGARAAPAGNRRQQSASATVIASAQPLSPTHHHHHHQPHSHGHPRHATTSNAMDDNADALAALSFLEQQDVPQLKEPVYNSQSPPQPQPTASPSTSVGQPAGRAPSPGGSDGSSLYRSSFAPSKAAAARKAKADAQQAAHVASVTRPGRANGKPPRARKAGAWGDSSDEEEEDDEEDEEVDSDGEPTAPAQGSQSGHTQQQQQLPLPQSAGQLRSAYGYPPRVPSPLAGGADGLPGQARPARNLPQVPPGSRMQMLGPHDSDEAYASQLPRRSAYEDIHGGQAHPHLTTHAPVPTVPKNIWNQVLDPNRAPGALPEPQANLRDTFIQLEAPEATMTKAFTPHGLLSAGLQDKQDRSAKKQEELARESGAALINVPNKPPPPQTGLLGAITAHERERKREGGVGATLTEREREKRMAEERQRKLDELQRQQLEQMSQGGSMYGVPQGYGGYPMMNPMMMGMNPMMSTYMGYPGMMPFGNPQHMFAAQQAQQAYQQAMMNFSQGGSQAGGDANGGVNPAQMNPMPTGSGFDPRMSMMMPMMSPMMTGGMGVPGVGMGMNMGGMPGMGGMGMGMGVPPGNSPSPSQMNMQFTGAPGFAGGDPRFSQFDPSAGASAMPGSMPGSTGDLGGTRNSRDPSRTGSPAIRGNLPASAGDVQRPTPPAQ